MVALLTWKALFWLNAPLVLLGLLAAPGCSQEGSCVVSELEPLCGRARRANVGNCLLCVRSHPDLHDCSDGVADRFCQGQTPQRAKPHIVMCLADDVGYANVGWNRPSPTLDVKTPTLDSLARDGIQLTAFYAFKYCAPSRSAFISGRDPIHVNVVNGQTTSINPNDPVSGYTGIPTEMTSIAEKMTSAGYRAHAVGKWDGARLSRPCD
eukprot:COSAG02_NODE_346_length_24113_cov_13.213001_13_plen_209_part_00